MAAYALAYGVMALVSSLPASFRAIFDREFAPLCRALRRLGVRERDVADAAQEVFLTVYAKLSEYDAAKPMRPWLYAFAVRHASNYRRLAMHRVAPTEDESHVWNIHGTVKQTDVSAKDLVMRALAKLDETQREAFVMHDLEGFSAPEVAEVTHAPLNTVYSRVRLARAAFRAAVNELQGGADGTS